MAAAIPFAKIAAPYVMSGIGSLIGKKMSGPSKGQTQAMDASKQGSDRLNAAAQPLLQQGGQLAQQGAGMLGQGAQALGPAASYYRNILGSRASANQAMAPEMTTAMEFYRGAENKAKRTLQGGSRDYATAELDRQKVGQMAGMLPSARANAAAGMLNVGQGYGGLGSQAISGGSAMTGQGTNALAQAGYLQPGQFDQATTVRDQEGEGGRAWGGLLSDIFRATPWGRGATGGGTSGGPLNPYYTGPQMGAR